MGKRLKCERELTVKERLMSGGNREEGNAAGRVCEGCAVSGE